MIYLATISVVIFVLEFANLPPSSLASAGFSWNDYDRYEQAAARKDSYREAQSKKASVIYPGTKWCGPGNIAENDNDLGSERETDLCCREHDMCPDIIEAGGTKYGLTNKAHYTRLNCSCDETFHRCLHRSNSNASGIVGIIYFDLIRTKCFAKEHPVVSCAKEYEIPYTGDRRCKEYTTNDSEPTQWQWFDVPKY